MILLHTHEEILGSRKPRASGDDPLTTYTATPIVLVNPARAGMIRYSPSEGESSAGKPRASGDDPYGTITAPDTLS